AWPQRDHGQDPSRPGDAQDEGKIPGRPGEDGGNPGAPSAEGARILNVRMMSRAGSIGHSVAHLIARVHRSRDRHRRIGLLSSAAKISIVDDDESVRAAMSSLVRSLGYQACEFASAEAFLASPDLQDTSCLIADIQMPGMNGLELQDALLARQQGVPIIFITAFPADRIRQR